MTKLADINYQGDGVDLHYCCRTCHDSVKNLESPVILFYPCTIVVQVVHCPAAYRFTFCPWCHFHYYNKWDLWDRALIEAHGIVFDDRRRHVHFDDLPPEFRTDEWWIQRKYFDFTQSYGAKEISPADPLKKSNYCCKTMYALLDPDGYDGFRSYVKYLPHIRAYAIKYKGKRFFKFLDYCPFCGVTFPARLDHELTKILQTEYGLKSWVHYRKAPEEFHSDLWWKKRGL